MFSSRVETGLFFADADAVARAARQDVAELASGRGRCMSRSAAYADFRSAVWTLTLVCIAGVACDGSAAKRQRIRRWL